MMPWNILTMQNSIFFLIEPNFQHWCNTQFIFMMRWLQTTEAYIEFSCSLIFAIFTLFHCHQEKQFREIVFDLKAWMS